MANRSRTLPELLAAVTGGVLLGAVLVVAVDGLFALAGLGTFGDASGMFAVFPAAFFLYDEYKAVRRPGLALLCAVLALVIGSGAGYATSRAADVPPLASGGVAALVAAVIYATLWYTGTRQAERNIQK